MAVKIVFATPLRRFTGGVRDIEVEATTVGEALERAVDQFPDLRQRLFDDGSLRQDARIFLNGRDIRGLQGEGTPLGASDEITILPLVAGA